MELFQAAPVLRKVKGAAGWGHGGNRHELTVEGFVGSSKRVKLMLLRIKLFVVVKASLILINVLGEEREILMTSCQTFRHTAVTLYGLMSLPDTM